MHTPLRVLARALAATVVGGLALVPAAVPAAAVDPAPKQSPDSFHVATFNVLGNSHKAARSGQSRMKGTMRYLAKHDVSLVGFQELEPSQYAAFARQSNGAWGAVGAPSRSGKSTDMRNAIAFKKSQFELVSATHMAIPYFYGKTVNIPVVTLRSVATRAEFTMVNTHNAADVHGPAQRWRNEATKRQVKLVKKLRSEGRTVFVTGDMNERAPYFCKMTASGTMHAASGGSNDGACRANKANGIDWIFGSKDVAFSHWTMDTSTRGAGVSDHPFVWAQATLPAQPYDAAGSLTRTATGTAATSGTTRALPVLPGLG